MSRPPRTPNHTLPTQPPRTLDGMAAALLAAHSGGETGAAHFALHMDPVGRREWEAVAAMVLSWLPVPATEGGA